MTLRDASPGTKIVFATLSGAALLSAATACSSGTSAEADPAPAVTSSPAASAPAAPGTSGGSSLSSGSTYKDGSYTEDGDYVSPNGPEHITVDITLKDDTISAVTVTPHPDNPNTKQFQAAFAGAISGAVVGKDIDQISVSRLAGSSLTSTGFKDAVSKIKADASS